MKSLEVMLVLIDVRLPGGPGRPCGGCLSNNPGGPEGPGSPKRVAKLSIRIIF